MHDRDRLFIPYGRRPGEGGSARVDLRMVAFFAVVLLLLALAGWLYLRQASEVAELASEIRQLEMDKEARHRELVTLHGQVAMLGSLKRVLNEGIEMGYRLPDVSSGTGQLVIECSTNCVAPDPAGNSAAVADSGDVGAGASDLWNGLLGRLGDWIKMAAPAW